MRRFDLRPFLRLRAAALTTQRVRGHAAILVVCSWMPLALLIWTGQFAQIGSRVAGDFSHFYVLGSLAVQGRANALYDEPAQFEELRRVSPQFGTARYLPVYGPQVSLLFAPFAMLPYRVAVAAWLLMSGILYGACCYAVWKSCLRLRGAGATVALVGAGFPGFQYLIAFGHISALALVCVTLAYFALRANRRFFAGLAIGSLFFKPPLGIAAAFVFVLGGEWPIVGGAVTAALAQLGTAWLCFGPAVITDYWHTLRQLPELASVLEPRPFQMHSLRAFFQLLLPWPRVAFGMYVVVAVGFLLVGLLVWRTKAPLTLRFGVLVLVTVLVDPHVTLYDLVVLAPALLLACDWSLDRPHHPLTPIVRLSIYGCCSLPLLGPFATVTHLQPSTLALATLALALAHAARGAGNTAMAEE